MKKLFCLLTLCFVLTACGGEAPASAPAAPDLTAEECAQAVLAAGTFSETLETIEPAVAASLYGVDEALILDCAAYLSTGATAEECVFLLFADEADALDACQGFQLRVEEQIDALRNYQPAELPKLDDASHGTLTLKSGEMAYLVVSGEALDVPHLLMK